MPSPYQIVDIAGTGTYGTVVKARRVNEPRPQPLALKVLKEHHIANPKVMKRTRDEAMMLALMDHPNIVKVYGLEEIDDRPVVVMEWVDAIPLGDLIDETGKGLPPDVACELTRQAFLALHYAYEDAVGPGGKPLRIVHRDLKPNNILISVKGELKLVDFGIAKADFDGRESITQSMVLGTRGYMAPERLDGGDDHPSADAYAMAIIFFELLQGQAMNLSLNERYHQDRLDRALFDLNAAGFTPRAWSKLRRLIASMCHYEWEERPSHLEIAEQIGAVMSSSGMTPDLAGYAQRVIQPMHRGKRGGSPKLHEAYVDVAFLDAGRVPAKSTVETPTGADPRRSREVDDQIRHLLASDRWQTQLPALQRLLARSPEWTPEPFIEILDAALAPRWKLKARPPARKVAVALELLRNRNDAAVLERAAALVTHPDEMVVRTAKAVLAKSSE